MRFNKSTTHVISATAKINLKREGTGTPPPPPPDLHKAIQKNILVSQARRHLFVCVRIVIMHGSLLYSGGHHLTYEE